MNVEELREIAETVVADLERTNAVANLQSLQQSLQTLVSSPADPTAQSNVAAARSTLEADLRSGELDEANPRWRDLLVGMDAAIVIPDVLLSRVADILTQSELTPQVANDEVNALFAEINAARTHMRNVVDAFDHLGIEASSLNPGEFEAAVLIPRSAVSNNLSELGQEFKDLETLIRPFIEIDGGSPPPVQVRQIASSDFLTALALAPSAALLLSKAIDGVLGVYERVLKIRKLRGELADAGLQEATIGTIEQDATEMVEREIPAIVREVLAGAAGLTSDNGRQNEIEIALTKSVAGIARRIDHGFRMTVRAGPPVENNETDEDGEPAALTDAEIALNTLRAQIVDNQRRADTQELEGEPILRELSVEIESDDSPQID